MLEKYLHSYTRLLPTSWTRSFAKVSLISALRFHYLSLFRSKTKKKRLFSRSAFLLKDNTLAVFTKTWKARKWRCMWFCDMNQPWMYMCHPSQNPVPNPSPSHSSGVSQCPGLECPVSCIEVGLVIYFTYGNIHISILFSQIIPPSPSPRVQKSVLYVCVSFAILHIGSSLPSF